MENTSTRTPNKRATIKCPHSCTRIRMPRTRTKPIAMFMLWTKPLLSLSHGSSPLRAADLRGNASRYFGNFFLGHSTGLGVRRKHIFHPLQTPEARRMAQEEIAKVAGGVA